jgi:serine/threonine protein kinase
MTMDAPGMLSPGEVFAGRYRIIKSLGQGGMGAIYQVEDIITTRHRALKLMHPNLISSSDARVRFEREVRVGARIQSEHIVEVVDAGVDPRGFPFLVMELLRGEELAAMVRRVGRLQPHEALPILSQIGRALDRAHQQGIIHRDLKPENVFITQREDGTMHAKLLDFGIAKIIEDAQTGQTTQPAGTALYMAPEQTDRRGVSAVTDVWALGLMTYVLLVGRSYWNGDMVSQLFREILVDPMGSAEARARESGVMLPPGFDAWFFQCVEREPSRRLPSAGAAVQALATVLGMATGRAPTPAFTPVAPPIATQPMGPGAHRSSAGTDVGVEVRSTGTRAPASRVPMFALGLVPVLAIGGGIAWWITHREDAPIVVNTDSGAPSPGGEDHEPPKPKPKPAAPAAPKNEFLAIGSTGVSLQEHEVSCGEWTFVANKPEGATFPKIEACAKGNESMPVVNLPFEDASAYCNAIEARLPTAAEWDSAVKGTDARTFPWGKKWSKDDIAVDKGKDAEPIAVATSSADIGPYGHRDLAGNVREFTATPGASPEQRLLRGSDVAHGEMSFTKSASLYTRASGAAENATKDSRVGFRCAK